MRSEDDIWNPEFSRPRDVGAEGEAGHDELHEGADPLLQDVEVGNFPAWAGVCAPGVCYCSLSDIN